MLPLFPLHEETKTEQAIKKQADMRTEQKENFRLIKM